MRAAFGGMVPEKTEDALKDWLLTRAAAQDQKMALGLMRDMTALDTKDLMKEAHVPVRCINSGGGYQFFRPTSIELNKKYADYNAVMIDNVGHYPMLEKPAEFNQKLGEVLQEFAAKK
jgi:pimeloyl-ACP methyl ester carboxylesterase